RADRRGPGDRPQPEAVQPDDGHIPLKHRPREVCMQTRVSAARIGPGLHANRQGSVGERSANQADELVGRLVDVTGSEAEEADAGIEQAVLTSVVFRQRLPVEATVIFEPQPLRSIEQIWAPCKSSRWVVDCDLSLGPGKAAED